MQCPKCFEFLPKQFPPGVPPTCPSCGTNVTLHVSVGRIKEDLAAVEAAISQTMNEVGKALTRTKTSVTNQVASLKERLEALEEQIPVDGTPASTVIPAESTTHPAIPPVATPKIAEEPGSGISPAPSKPEAALPREPQSPNGPPPSLPIQPVTPRAPGLEGLGTARKTGPSFKPPTPRPAEESIDFGLSEVGLGQKWLLIVGILFIVLGAAFFLKYAFDQNWVTPAGRVALAYVLGIILLGTGEGFRRKDLEVFGLYLIGGGIATFYVSTYSAFQWYDVISQTPAFGIMVLITVLAGSLSLVYDNKWLAVLGLVGGFLTPILVSTGKDNQVALMTYMTILNLGILSIGVFKRWKLLNYLGFFFTWVLFSGWYAKHYTSEKFFDTTLFLNIFFLIYACLPFAEYFAQVKRNEEAEFDLLNFALTVPNTLWAFGFSYATISEIYPQAYVSIVSISYTALFAGMANYIYRNNKRTLEPFILLLAMALISLIVTVPMLFTGHWITIFWSAQAIALLWAALRLANLNLTRGATLLLAIAMFRFVFWDWTPFWLGYNTAFHDHLLDRWLTSLVFLGVMFQFARMMKNEAKDDSTANALYGLFTVILLLVLSFEEQLFFKGERQKQAAGLSVLWSVFSISMVLIGFIKHLSLVRKCAIGLFIITIMKVFFIDMENASTPFRIISFMVLGVMLVGASFLYHKYKNELLAAIEEKESRL